jgi:hypothetical protein
LSAQRDFNSGSKFSDEEVSTLRAVGAAACLGCFVNMDDFPTGLS